jgi:hypothetical protein
MGLNMGKVQSNTTCSVYMYVHKHYELYLTVLYPYYDAIQHSGDVSSERVGSIISCIILVTFVEYWFYQCIFKCIGKNPVLKVLL